MTHTSPPPPRIPPSQKKTLNLPRPADGLNSRNRKRIGEVIKSGYPVLHLPSHPRSSAIGYVFRHVLEMEKHLGRTPTREEHIHHIDLDRANYHISNLHLCRSNSEHQRIHASINKVMSQLIKAGMVRFDGSKYNVAPKFLEKNAEEPSGRPA